MSVKWIADAMATVARHGWQPGAGGGHRHLIALHRHPSWPCHPNPGRWHGHLWWWHRHATDELMRGET